MNKNFRFIRLGQSGLSQLGMLLTVLILGVGTYVGMQVVPFYIYYFEIEGHFEAQANKAAAKTDKEIRDFLWEQIRKANLPVEEKDLRIIRSGNLITIEMKYEEVLILDLGGDRVYDLWVFKFHPKIQKKLA